MSKRRGRCQRRAKHLPLLQPDAGRHSHGRLSDRGRNANRAKGASALDEAFLLLLLLLLPFAFLGYHTHLASTGNAMELLTRDVSSAKRPPPTTGPAAWAATAYNRVAPLVDAAARFVLYHAVYWIGRAVATLRRVVRHALLDPRTARRRRV